MRITGLRCKPWLLPALVLAYLWSTLINHLRIEWALNPQYSYGWAVPIICLYLIHLQRQAANASGTQPEPGIHSPRCVIAPAAFTVVLYSLALAWLPLRLVQEANPEWRLVSWSMALTVVALTLLVLATAESRNPLITNRHAFVFPIVFFLVAVPWPTVIEAPLIQGLTSANANCATELLNLFGVSALRHGSLIEVGNGVVGIDDACSGIRSFQATLMISLFLGNLYRLTVPRRLSLCLSGFGLSFVFNVGRTTLLTWVAAGHGIAAIQRWHDPAGGILLVLCFVTLWLLALSLRPRRNPSREPAPSSLLVRVHRSPFLVPHSSAALLVWFLLCEISTTAWYRLHESGMPATTKWTVTWPTNSPSFHKLPFSEQARQNLRYDEGINAGWIGPEGCRWQVIFLRWNPGKIAVHLARTHTPQSCLPASGRQILAVSEVRLLNVGGLSFPFRHYVAEDRGRPLHIFYCLWEDRAPHPDVRGAGLSLRNRLEPVLAGRRNLGQRSLEVAVWGIQDGKEAEAALVNQIKVLVSVPTPYPLAYSPPRCSLLQSSVTVPMRISKQMLLEPPL